METWIRNPACHIVRYRGVRQRRLYQRIDFAEGKRGWIITKEVDEMLKRLDRIWRTLV
ncbi:hypothetical protein AN958_00457 [Leucoagaricus sp. SymC.cos]|nr:hypothetical protein AN958_00457 [Leucoagaricus sp. SymC.cos]